mmetsp:Transcript_66589/g.205913  ORF Transcript_66589/g.205913 Transcript_66589/m.205913 type:complete len:89 (-) Transcript_66589:15-281(-)
MSGSSTSGAAFHTAIAAARSSQERSSMSTEKNAGWQKERAQPGINVCKHDIPKVKTTCAGHGNPSYTPTQLLVVSNTRRASSTLFFNC